VLEDDDRADEVEDESIEDYADRKRLVITNARRRVSAMPNGNGGDTATKADLQDYIDQATEILEDAYTPESSREDLAAAIGDALDALGGNGGDEDDDDDDADDEDDVA
jgi:hypothetical protein